MALWSALIVTVDALVCVYEWVWVGVCFCHSFSVSFILFFFCSFFTSITNLNNRVKSGKVNGISVQKQNVAGRTVTHNLGRPNVPVVTLDIGDSKSYAWGNTQISVYDITNNDFKVKIYNSNTVTGNFGFNWIVVATD